MIFDEETDKELASYGVTECDCDLLAEPFGKPPCTLCGENSDSGDHVHYKGQIFDSLCLMLALLRELNQRTQ